MSEIALAIKGIEVITRVVADIARVRAMAKQGDITPEEAERRIDAIYNPPTDEILGPRE